VNKTPLSQEDVRNLGVRSLALERAIQFLDALKTHDFLCLIADNDSHVIRIFTKGDDPTIFALARLAESAIEEG